MKGTIRWTNGQVKWCSEKGLDEEAELTFRAAANQFEMALPGCLKFTKAECSNDFKELRVQRSAEKEECEHQDGVFVLGNECVKSTPTVVYHLAMILGL